MDNKNTNKCRNCTLFLEAFGTLGWRQCSKAIDDEGEINLTKSTNACICADEFENCHIES